MKEKIKPKNGFTIIELMAVIVIIAILATLVIGGVLIYRDNANDEYYESLKNQIVLSGKNYYSDNPSLKPHGQVSDNGQKVIGKKLYVQDLLNNNYLINDVVGANGEDCSESYLVVRMQEENYKYDVCLLCDGTAYDDKDDKICEITDDELVTNIDIDIDFDV